MMNGIHGTTAEIAQIIRRKGFESSSIGRAGSGVYFWRYFNNDKHAKYLSNKWWDYCKKAGKYNKIGGNTNCCYISVKLKTDNYIDLSHGVMREIIIELISSKLDEIKSISNIQVSEEEKIISAMFKTFVEQIEKDENISFDAVIVGIPPPKGALGKLGQYIGSCAEAMVVQNLDVINIIKIEEIENGC